MQTRAVAQIVAAAAPRLARHLRRIDESRSPELADAQPLACLFQAAACDTLCTVYAACAAVLHARRTPHERAISCTRQCGHCLRRRAMPHASLAWRNTPSPLRARVPAQPTICCPMLPATPLLHTAAAYRCCAPCTPLLHTTRDAVHQAALLRLKREMASYEQACRVWEVCWAAGGDFHLKVLAGLVLSQQAWARGARISQPHIP